MMSAPGDGNLEDDDSGYKVPVKKTLAELKKMDAEDESLRRYKEALLGSAVDAIPFPNNPKTVVLDSFSVCVENQPEQKISLLDGSDLNKNAGNPVPIPEGSNYYIKVNYYVQRDIVTGLQFRQGIYRGPLKVTSSSCMMGSYAPQKDIRTWKSELFEAPKGAVHRGTYNIKSSFADADKNEFASWKWAVQIVKGSS